MAWKAFAATKAGDGKIKKAACYSAGSFITV
jgi:hypothetical protein